MTLAEFRALSTAQQKALPHPIWSALMAQELAENLTRHIRAKDQKAQAQPPQR